MGQITLSKLQKRQYNEIKELFTDSKSINLSDEDNIRLKEVLLLLSTLGYIRPLEIDNGNVYFKQGNFEDFEAWHKDRAREERKLRNREIKIAVVSAIVGAVIGLIPFIATTVVPWLIKVFSK